MKQWLDLKSLLTAGLLAVAGAAWQTWRTVDKMAETIERQAKAIEQYEQRFDVALYWFTELRQAHGLPFKGWKQ